MHQEKGITLLEIVFTLTLIAFLISSIAFVYIVTLRGWDNLGHRSNLHEKLHFGLERIVRDVREARAISVASHSLMFTLNENGSDNHYIYYLHNASDVCPMAYSQTAYDLRRTQLTSGSLPGSLDCSRFAYGNGEVIITSLKPPSADTSITSGGNYAIVKLVGVQEEDTLTVRGNVKPRNI